MHAALWQRGRRMEAMIQARPRGSRAWTPLDSGLALYTLGLPFAIVLLSVRWWYPFPLLSCLSIGAWIWYHLAFRETGNPEERRRRAHRWATAARGAGIAALVAGFLLIPASVVIAALTEFKMGGPELMTPTLVHPWGIGHACRVLGGALIVWGFMLLQSGRDVRRATRPSPSVLPAAPISGDCTPRDVNVAVGFIVLMASTEAETPSQRLSTYLRTADPRQKQRTWAAVRAVLTHWNDGALRNAVITRLHETLPHMDADAVYEELSGYDRVFSQLAAPSPSRPA